VDGPTVPVGSGGPTLRAGGEGNAYLLSGGFDAEGEPTREICTGAVGSGSIDPERLAASAHVWRLHAKLLSATMENVVVFVEWSRTDAARRGVTRLTTGGFTTVTLPEGGLHTLDFLASPTPEDTCGASLRVDLDVAVEEDARFVQDSVEYELWLVDDARSGSGGTHRLRMTGAQGESLNFAFPALTWPLPDVRFADGRNGSVAATVTGAIRGRIRDDGSIDLFLEAHRDIGIVGRQTRGAIGDHGRKSLRVGPAETLGLTLPPAKGTHTLALDESWGSVFGVRGMTSEDMASSTAASGVERTDEAVSVDFAKFLGDHTMSLRLTARRIPSGPVHP
jgi:hypothetical protein